MYRKEKKIPTIFAFLILLGGLATATFLDRSAQTVTSLANKTPIPAEVHFTNISDNSFTVSWLTSSPATGAIVATTGVKKSAILDDLDSDNIPRPRITHYVTVKNLSENVSVSVKIISGSENCNEEKFCPTFAQKTGAKLLSPLALPPVRGSLFTQEGKPAEGVIVYLTIGKSAPLTGRVDAGGLWVIPLTQLRTQDLLARPDFADSDIVQITAKLSETSMSTAIIDMKSIRQNLTIPQMIMGNSYNFIDLLSKKDALAALYSPQQNILGAKTGREVSSSQTNITPPVLDILFPKYDDDTTPDSRPRIRGTGKPGSQLLITVNSSPQTGKVTVGNDGIWNWRPEKELPPGVHHLTIQQYDEKGNLITSTRKFIVLKSGERVLGEATPSASLTPTFAPTLAPSLSPSPTPLQTPSPLPTSSTISPTLTSSPTASSPPPRSGTGTPTVLLIGISTLLLLTGAKLLILQ